MVRSFAYLCVSDIIEQKINIPLRKAFEMFVDCVKTEYTCANITVPKYTYHSADARDMFMRNLPVILAYGRSSSYFIKRSEI